MEGQEIESSPTGRFLSLSFGRHNGTVGVVQLNYTVLYIPAGDVDLSNAKDDILNVSSKNSVIFMPGQSQISIKLPIRNDAFLQNGASFLVQVSWYKTEFCNHLKNKIKWVICEPAFKPDFNHGGNNDKNE